jgi:hypothetical protein
MYLAMAGIYHQPFIVWFINQHFKQFLPYAFVAPANEAAVRVAPASVIRWQITPWRTCAKNPEYRVNKQTVILCNPAP